MVEAAQELYGLAPGEFVAARNARAKEAKAEDKALGQQIQQLPKASMAAWVVNMLVRHRHEQMSQLLDVGAALRQAQEDLDADALRELTRQRRRLVAAVSSDGRALAAELGERVSDQVARQVEETLTAAMVDEAAAAAVRSGVLVDSMLASGMGSVDVAGSVADPSLMGELGERFVARRGSGRAARRDAGFPERAGAPRRADGEDDRAGRLAAVPELDAERRRAEALVEARSRLEDARAAAAEANRKRTKVTRRLARLEARALQVQGEMEELRRRLAELEHEAERVETAREAAEAKKERVTARAERAAAAVEDAEVDVARFDG